MAEINELADERLSAEVSEVIAKYDLLADKMDVDITDQMERAEQAALSSEASAVSASQSATAAENAATTITQLISSTAESATSANKAATSAAESATSASSSAAQAHESVSIIEQKLASGEFKGETGEQGEQGIQGERGEQGMQGVQGIQGIQGIKGDTGTKGDKGDKGDSGSVNMDALYEASGYCDIGGFIVQWGKIEMKLMGGEFPLEFKKTFLTSCFACILSQPDIDTIQNDYFWRVGSLTKSGFKIMSKATGTALGTNADAVSYFIAVGR